MSTRILHLTDPHLHADPGFSHMGVNTRQSLIDVLEHVSSASLTADLILITGDLTHDETPQGYQQLKLILDTITTPIYVLPGNHDVPALIEQHLCSAQISNQDCIIVGPWQIIMLDSTIRGSECGALSESQIQRLEDCLDKHPDLYTLVCMHHQPIAVGSQWLDTMQIKNNEQFMQITRAHAQIKAVLWGHVHQAFTRQMAGIQWLASPATCRQFLADSDEFALDEKNEAGYRWLTLADSGEIETQVIWL